MKVLSRLNKINKVKVTSKWEQPAKIEDLGVIYDEEISLYLDDKGFWVDVSTTNGVWPDVWVDVDRTKTEAAAIKLYLENIQDEYDPEDIIEWASDSGSFNNGKFAKMLQKGAKALAKKLKSYDDDEFF